MRPTKTESFLELIQKGIRITYVLDIGVQFGTKELMETFPNAHHILVEPAIEYHEGIRQAYRHIPHTLIGSACGEKSGQAYLNIYDQSNSGNVTHTSISSIPISTSNRTIEILTISDIIDTYKHVQGESLLKVDVDSIELEILQGAGNCLDAFSVIAVECPISIDNSQFFERINYLSGKGFELWDIVDMCYYRGCLSQVDAIFISKEAIAKHPSLKPWQEPKAFDPNEWTPLFQ